MFDTGEEKDLTLKTRPGEPDFLLMEYVVNPSTSANNTFPELPKHNFSAIR